MSTVAILAQGTTCDLLPAVHFYLAPLEPKGVPVLEDLFKNWHRKVAPLEPKVVTVLGDLFYRR